MELGLASARLEGLNIRLINHRGYGHHRAAALIAMVYLGAGGVTIDLPGANASAATREGNPRR